MQFDFGVKFQNLFIAQKYFRTSSISCFIHKNEITISQHSDQSSDVFFGFIYTCHWFWISSSFFTLLPFIKITFDNNFSLILNFSSISIKVCWMFACLCPWTKVGNFIVGANSFREMRNKKNSSSLRDFQVNAEGSKKELLFDRDRSHDSRKISPEKTCSFFHIFSDPFSLHT